ncbi:MAG: zinc-binding dehydrogenase, partial [Planctomycetota bacterium]
IKSLTGGKGIDVYFDPVASGEYLTAEVRSLARGGRIYIYGLLGDPGPVDLSPMIIRNASLHGWVLDEIIRAGDTVWRQACHDILKHVMDGAFVQHIGGVYPLSEAQRAHEEMERGRHIGKLVLVP